MIFPKGNTILHLMMMAICFVVISDNVSAWGGYKQVADLVLHPADGNLYFDRACDASQMQADTLNSRTITSLEERKKLRWVWKSFKQKVFYHVHEYTGTRTLGIFFRLFHAAFLFFTFLFINKIVRLLLPQPMASRYAYYGFFLFILFLFFTLEVPIPEFEFSVVEGFCIAVALWACLCKRVLPYLGALFLAVLSRESGVLIAAFWLVFYPKESRAYFFLLAGPLLLLLVNLDVLECLMRPDFLVTARPQAGQTMLLDRSSYSLFSLTQVVFRNFIIFWVPIIALRKYFRALAMKRLLVLFAAYNIIFLFGATLDHPASKLLLAPILIPLCLTAVGEKENGNVS